MKLKNTLFWMSIIIISLLCVTSCSDNEGPHNLEPVITINEAYDITRTEATLSVEISERGTGSLSYLNFYYGDDSGESIKTETISDPSGTVSIRLTGLKAGTTYLFYVIGGTQTANIKSDEMSFTTLPNEVPSVSAASVLESGPTAIIVGFRIESDGGENISEAGCMITDIATNSTSRHLIDSTSISDGSFQVLISSLSVLSEYEIVPFATNALGTGEGQSITFVTEDAIRLSAPGYLSEIVGEYIFSSDSISISGKMNGDDFRFLRRLLNAPSLPGESEIVSSLCYVDISDVDVLDGGTTYDGSRFTSDGTISTGLFADCNTLTTISLPLSATSIERNAFKNCPRLQSLTISPGITSIIPSEGCYALSDIKVSDANQCFRSEAGVLLNADATEIVWFPIGKTGDYILPSSVIEICENAFDEAKISSISLHDNITHIGRGAFANSLLESVSLPDKLTNLYEATFQGCVLLKSIKLGSGIQFLGNYLFDGCPLQDIYIGSLTPPYVSSDCFTNNTDLFEHCILHVTSGTRKIYRLHSIWGKFNTITED